MKRVAHAATATLVALGLILACTSKTAAPAQGAATPRSVNPLFTPADTKFMQGMIGHHAQAIVMATMSPTHGADSRVLKLSEKIRISQTDEIKMMETWLKDRSQEIPDSTHRMHAMMPGMIMPAQLAELDQARGEKFDSLFLTFMIQHHGGALLMVDTLFAAKNAAQDPDIFRFVTDVQADQQGEIDAMQQMLYDLPGSATR